MLPIGHGMQIWAKHQDNQLIAPDLQVETAVNHELIDRCKNTSLKQRMSGAVTLGIAGVF